MRNIIRLIQQNSNLLLFLMIQGISFVLIFNWRNSYHHSSFLSSSNYFLGSALDMNADITNYFKLSSINKGLVSENEMLKTKLYNQELLLTNDFLVSNDSVYKKQFQFLATKVISSQYKNRANFIVINQGSINGVSTNMGVVGDHGVLGIVVGVGKHYSSVLPIINSKFELAVRHQATKSFGILKWNSSDNWQTATIEDVPSYMNVKIGDLIETSGASGLFPQGIVVGTVVKSEKIPATQFLKIKISLVEDYASVVSAYVVENKQLPELNRVKKLKHD